MAKLSIIIPVFNVALYITECIDSIINQTYRDIEIIIVDDGSTDESPKIVDNLAQNDDRIKVIHQKNMGLPGARNTGIAKATGAYIGFIDSDDVIDKEMYQLLIESIIKEESQLAVCNISRFNKDQLFKSQKYKNCNLTYPESKNFFHTCLDSSCNKLYIRDIIETHKIYFEDKSIVPQEDFYFLFKYISHCNKICFISDNLYLYRLRRSSITSSKQTNLMKGSINFIHLIDEYIQTKNIKRNIDDFKQFLIIEMFMSSINDSHATQISDLILIINFFKKHKAFNEAIKVRLTSLRNSFNIRDAYIYLVLKMLQNHMTLFPATLEFLRIKKLYHNKEITAFP